MIKVMAVALGVVAMCSLTACGIKSDEEIQRENAVAALEVCHEGEMLEMVEPQTVYRRNSDASVFRTEAIHAPQASGELWAESTWDYVSEWTPKPTESDPNPKTRSGFPAQRNVVLHYKLSEDYVITRLYVSPVHGAGSELEPSLAPGSSGVIEFDTGDYAESEMIGGVYFAAQIESISVCTQRLI